MGDAKNSMLITFAILMGGYVIIMLVYTVYTKIRKWLRNRK